MLSIYGELDSYIFTGGTTSEVVIACINSFSQSCAESTTIVMDQALIHTNKRIENKLLEWETKGIHIFWLPTDSPQLDLIEILWRFMKYEWIELSAYESLGKLASHIEKVLKGFGKEYIINFA